MPSGHSTVLFQVPLRLGTDRVCFCRGLSSGPDSNQWLWHYCLICYHYISPSWCLTGMFTHVSTTGDYDPNGTTSTGYDPKTFWPHDITSVVCPLFDIHPFSLQCLVTHNMTSHLFDRDCDITSKFLLSKSGSNHKSTGHPKRCACSLCTVKKEPWISVPCALT
jgi:hypothetical protein